MTCGKVSQVLLIASDFLLELNKLTLAFLKLFFLSCDLQKRLDFGEELPPWPVAQFEVCLAVALDHVDGLHLLNELLELPESLWAKKETFLFSL